MNPTGGARQLHAAIFSTAAAAHRTTSAETLRAEPSLDLVDAPGELNYRGPVAPAPAFRGRRVQIVYALIDVCCVAIDGIFAFLLRFPPDRVRELLAPGNLVGMDKHYAAFLLLDAGLIVLFCQSQRLYRTPLEQPSSAESAAICKAVLFATLLLTAFVYLSGVKIVSRAVVVISAALNVASLAAWRYAKRRLVIRRIERGIGTRNALIVGAGSVGQAIARMIEQNKLLGYQFVGFLDRDESSDSRVLGGIADIARVVRAQFVDEIFITIPSEREMVKSIAFAAREQRLAVKVIPDLYDGLGWNAPLCRLGNFPAMDICWTPVPGLRMFAKRTIDVCLASIGLLLTAPLCAAIALLVPWDSTGPVLYSSNRVGRKGRVFTCHKFRTMVANADELKESLRGKNERQGPFFKINDDPRVTPLGKFLRKYSLDELPQLWNVLLGDMSLVGPRPHPVDDFSRYSLDHLRRLEVKPGITGLWQVTARRDPSFDTSMRLDLEYIEKWNLRLDLEIMMRTLSNLGRAEGC